MNINKKGQFDVARKSISWMIMGSILTMAVLALVVVLSIFQSTIFSVPGELSASIVSQRFVNTPECFTYQDPITERIHPGIIDINKFTQARMDDCYRTENDKGYESMNFGIYLEGFESETVLRSNNFFNNVDYTLYESVLVLSGTELVPTRLVIYVQEKI